MRIRRHARASPPILSFGRLRIDWPTRDRSPANLAKFAAFVLLLLALFILLYHFQAKWLMNRNARQFSPSVPAALPPP